MTLTFDDYQKFAKTTAIYDKAWKLIYPSLGIAEEAGEVAGKVKKMLRDDDGVLTPERHAMIVKELGDVLWYAAAIASDLDVNLSDVAQVNMNKLSARKAQDQIKGDGDDRELTGKVVQASGKGTLFRPGMSEPIEENAEATE